MLKADKTNLVRALLLMTATSALTAACGGGSNSATPLSAAPATTPAPGDPAAPVPAVLTVTANADSSPTLLAAKYGAIQTSDTTGANSGVGTVAVAVPANNITVASLDTFVAGDKVLVIQMEDDATLADIHNAGSNYEIRTIASVTPVTDRTQTGALVGAHSYQIAFTQPLTNSYRSNLIETTQAEIAQIVSIPQYQDVTVQTGGVLSTIAWNGQTGGVLAMNVSNNLTVAGKIQMTAAGYRGGDKGSLQGESLSGFRGYGQSANYGGGGANAASWTYYSGGGGAYATDGEGASNVISGGNSYGVTDLSKIYFGSGGGGGSAHAGSAGGGIVMLTTNKLTMQGGSVEANGGGAGLGQGMIWDFGGAGAGGAIYVSAQSVTNSMGSMATISAAGGARGTDGGGGGNGRIHFTFTDPGFTTTPAAQ